MTLQITFNDLTSDFINEFSESNLSQLNNIRNSRGTILDLILTDIGDSFSAIRIPETYIKASSVHHHPLAITLFYDDKQKSPKLSFVKRQKFDLEYATERLLDITNSTDPYKKGVFRFELEDIATITDNLTILSESTTSYSIIKVPLWTSRHPWLRGDVEYFKLRDIYRKSCKNKSNDIYQIEEKRRAHEKVITRYTFLKTRAISSLMESSSSQNNNATVSNFSG